MTAPAWVIDGARRGVPGHRELLADYLAAAVRHRDGLIAARDGSGEAELDIRDAQLCVLELKSHLDARAS